MVAAPGAPRCRQPAEATPRRLQAVGFTGRWPRWPSLSVTRARSARRRRRRPVAHAAPAAAPPPVAARSARSAAAPAGAIRRGGTAQAPTAHDLALATMFSKSVDTRVDAAFPTKPGPTWTLQQRGRPRTRPAQQRGVLDNGAEPILSGPASGASHPAARHDQCRSSWPQGSSVSMCFTDWRSAGPMPCNGQPAVLEQLSLGFAVGAVSRAAARCHLPKLARIV